MLASPRPFFLKRTAEHSEHGLICCRMDMPTFKHNLKQLQTLPAAGPSRLSYDVPLSAMDEVLAVCLAFVNLFLHFGALGPLHWLQSGIMAIQKSSEVGWALTYHVRLAWWRCWV